MNITKQDILDALTYEKFEEYLRGKNPRGIAGECGIGTKCAIAKYLTEFNPIENFHYIVSDIKNRDKPNISIYEKIDPYSAILRTKSPNWTREFIRKFDETGSERLTNSRALKILQSIKP